MAVDPQTQPGFDTPVNRGPDPAAMSTQDVTQELNGLLDKKGGLSPGEANRARRLNAEAEKRGVRITNHNGTSVESTIQAQETSYAGGQQVNSATRDFANTVGAANSALASGPTGSQAVQDEIARQNGQIEFSRGASASFKNDLFNQQRGYDANTIAGLNSLAAQQQAAAGAANTSNTALYNTYASQNAGLNAADQQALGGYMSATDPLMAMRAAGMGSSYASNPQDIAAQQQALAMLQGIAGGSLDYQSQGAQAYADPKLIQQQNAILGQMQGVAGGSLDLQSLAAQAHADPETVAKQKMALDKLYSLTDPTVTPNERFMYEQLRRASESDQASYRDAVMQDLAQRGMMSGAAVIGNQLSQAQEIGNQRVLGELGIQAAAVNRSQQALGMYVDAQGRLRSQEFDEAFSRAAAGDQMAVANANRRLQAMGMSADQVNAMRNASFDEAYKRGLAADAASANNQQTRLSGSVAAGNQSNAIRSANDAVGMFNTEQGNIMQRHADDYAQQEAIRTGNLANQRLGAQQGTNATIGNRNTATFTAGQGTNQTNLGNTTTANGTSAGALTTGQGIYAGTTGLGVGLSQQAFGNTIAASGQQTANLQAARGVAESDADREAQAKALAVGAPFIATKYRVGA